jgi:hypothetical protein
MRVKGGFYLRPLALLLPHFLAQAERSSKCQHSVSQLLGQLPPLK